MKTMIDKEFTSIAHRDNVKNALKEFKTRLTENDILAMFNDATYNHVYGDVLEMVVKGFDVNAWSDDVSFRVEMRVYAPGCAFFDVSFYMDMVDDDITVCTRDMNILVNVHKFTLNR